ncbi:alpha/beta hydrolase [Massilia sp. DD77]|uniref:alpha/beta hydrolase n=1 Tax=Massilia sp. DD77 TaxID=3109349 RepID=UPI002FFF843B
MRARLNKRALGGAILAALVLGPACGIAAPAAPAAGRNVVIVPGAFIDGSSWRVVHDILYHKGYRVSIVPVSHATLEDDVAATRRVLAQQTGKVVLVGGGIGGAVIGHAGQGDKVKALVYVAALAPEVGESAGQLLRAIPAASTGARPDFSGLYWFDRDKFHEDLVADLSPNRAWFLAASQVPVSQHFLGTQSYAAVWRKKPSYAVVATRDRVLHPDSQRMMYKRARARITELDTSHAVQLARPEDVAAVIERAALDTF